MGCASSKLFKKDLKREILFGNGDFTTHVVSLTSSTYGALNLDKEQRSITTECRPESEKSLPPEPEVIDALELMEGLEEQVPDSLMCRRSPKSPAFLRGFADLDPRSPLKFLNQIGTPKKTKKFAGKENQSKISPKVDSLRIDSGVVLSRRRSLSPLLDPKIVSCFDKESFEENQQIKKMVSTSTPTWQKPRKSRDLDTILGQFQRKCPAGGQDAVVFYSTTLRGIRKTFEDCNVVRSILESHSVRMFERDVSMDSGFKEELRGIMGTKEVKVPLVFVKGRLIGGVDEVLKLEEEGKMGILFSGIPRAGPGCHVCGGVRFVMCLECSGSCKVLGEDGRKKSKCEECNENGLIQCPICSYL